MAVDEPNTFARYESLQNEVASNPRLKSVWGMILASLGARAQHALRYSGYQKPDLPEGFGSHSPQLCIWQYPGFSCVDSYSLTVFRSFYSNRVICRMATAHWDAKVEIEKGIAQLQAVIEGRFGDILPAKPEVFDADVPLEKLDELLEQLTACQIPAIPFWDRESAVTSSASCRFGFAVSSARTPQATITYEWTDDTPPEWEVVKGKIMQLHDFLLEHFHNGKTAEATAVS